MRKFILVVVFFAAVAGPLSAGFKNNFTQWREMEAYGQFNYVMGLVDAETNNFFTGEPEWITAQRQGIIKCTVALKLTAGMISDAITNHYQANPRDWSLPIVPVFQQAIRSICLDYINAERATNGLPAWKPSKGGIMDSMDR